ncbi:hypothetical protein ECIV_ORF33 [European chub iridovirus]|nr:hypothetical protein ECIV_ORF33 [European chub iridovirus]
MVASMELIPFAYETKRAIVHNPDQLLDIQTYADAVGFYINQDMLRVFGHKPKNVCVTQQVLEWLGYMDNSAKQQKFHFICNLKTHQITFRNIKYKSEEFYQHNELVSDAIKMTVRQLKLKKWIVLAYNDFVNLVPKLTKCNNSQLVYYFTSYGTLERMHTIYKIRYIQRQEEIKLHNMVVPPADNEDKRTFLAVFTTCPDYVHDPENDPVYLRDCNVRIVRSQRLYLEREFERFKTLGNGTNRDASVAFCEPSPNAVNVLVRIKERNVYRFLYNGGVGVVCDNIDNLVNAIRQIHDEWFYA